MAGKCELVQGIIHFGVYKETTVRLSEAKQLRELLQRPSRGWWVEWLFLKLGHVTEPDTVVLFSKESYFSSVWKNAFLVIVFLN